MISIVKSFIIIYLFIVESTINGIYLQDVTTTTTTTILVEDFKTTTTTAATATTAMATATTMTKMSQSDVWH